MRSNSRRSERSRRVRTSEEIDTGSVSIPGPHEGGNLQVQAQDSDKTVGVRRVSRLLGVATRTLSREGIYKYRPGTVNRRGTYESKPTPRIVAARTPTREGNHEYRFGTAIRRSAFFRGWQTRHEVVT